MEDKVENLISNWRNRCGVGRDLFFGLPEKICLEDPNHEKPRTTQLSLLCSLRAQDNLPTIHKLECIPPNPPVFPCNHESFCQEQRWQGQDIRCCPPTYPRMVCFSFFPCLLTKLPFLHVSSFEIPNNCITKYRSFIRTTTMPEVIAFTDPPINFPILVLVELPHTII